MFIWRNNLCCVVVLGHIIFSYVNNDMRQRWNKVSIDQQLYVRIYVRMYMFVCWSRVPPPTKSDRRC